MVACGNGAVQQRPRLPPFTVQDGDSPTVAALRGFPLDACRRHIYARAMKYLIRLLLMALALFAPDEYAQVAPAAFGPVVPRIQRADYEGDRAALQRLHDELAPVPAEPHAGSRVRYWRGFALWRRAINGFNDKVDVAVLEQDLRGAASE